MIFAKEMDTDRAGASQWLVEFSLLRIQKSTSKPSSTILCGNLCMSLNNKEPIGPRIFNSCSLYIIKVGELQCAFQPAGTQTPLSLSPPIPLESQDEEEGKYSAPVKTLLNYK